MKLHFNNNLIITCIKYFTVYSISLKTYNDLKQILTFLVEIKNHFKERLIQANHKQLHILSESLLSINCLKP